MPKVMFKIYEEDFIETIMAYEMFKQNLNVIDLKNKLIDTILYSGTFTKRGSNICIKFTKYIGEDEWHV